MIFHEKEGEVWVNTKYDGYQVSNYGRVRSCRYNFGKYDLYHVLRNTKSTSGYLQVHIRLGAFSKTEYVHRLVAVAFVPNPNGYKCINHKDEDPYNNRSDNLEWCDARYNNTYGSRALKMGESFAKAIIATYPDGSEHWFRSGTEAARVLGCQQSNIHKCLIGARRHTMGYKFRYV